MTMKKLLSLGLAATMMLAVMAGCSSSSSTESSTSSSTSSSTTTESTTSSSTTTESTAEEVTEIDWPEKSIQIVVPYAAGGDTDFNARTYAKYLEDELGESLAVVNITGNGGATASEEVKNSNPDGYTFLFFHTCLNINQATGIADFGPEAFDIVRVAGTSSGECIVVRADAPYDTVPELIAYSQEHPGEVKIAANTGATSHWASVVLAVEHEAEMNIVNAGGSSERVAALLGEHVDVLVNPIITVSDYVETGDFKYLCVNTPERLDYLPDVPTATEQGINLSYNLAYYMLAPKDTPTEIIDKMGAAMDAIAASPEYAEEIATAYNQTPYVLAGEEAINYITNENADLMQYYDYFQ